MYPRCWRASQALRTAREASKAGKGCRRGQRWREGGRAGRLASTASRADSNALIEADRPGRRMLQLRGLGWRWELDAAARGELAWCCFMLGRARGRSTHPPARRLQRRPEVEQAALCHRWPSAAPVRAAASQHHRERAPHPETNPQSLPTPPRPRALPIRRVSAPVRDPGRAKPHFPHAQQAKFQIHVSVLPALHGPGAAGAPVRVRGYGLQCG